ncbi:MAG: MotA/TolQ/ExbB proton channel family protein [bacterium]
MLSFVTVVFLLVIILMPWWWRVWVVKNREIHWDEIATIPPVLGLLGTFIGIAIVLYNYDVQGSFDLSNMIRGLRFAFLTSIAGIVVSFYCKLKHHRVSRAIPLEDDVDLKKLYIILCEIADRIGKDGDKPITHQIVDLRTDVKNLIEGHQEFIGKKIDELSEKIASELVRALFEEFVKVIKEFDEILRSQLGKVFEDLKVSVQELITWQREYREQLDFVNEQIRLMKGQWDDILKNVESMVERLERFSELFSVIEDILSRTRNEIDSLEKLIKGMPSLMNELRNILPQIYNELQRTSQQLIDELRNSLNDLNNQAKEITKTIDDFTQRVNKNIYEMIGSLKKYNQEFDDIQTRSLENLGKATVAIVEKYNVDLKNSFEGIENFNKVIDNLNGRITDIVKLLDIIRNEAFRNRE